MQYTRLGKNGLEVSRISLGTVQFGNDYGLTREKVQDEVDAILKCAAGQGITLLDTARDYGTSEEKIGRFLNTYPGCHFHVATKIARFPFGLPAQKNPGRIKSHILKSLELSLERLGKDSVAILQLHQLDRTILECDAIWACLDGLRREGIVTAVGVSVYEPDETRMLLERYGDVLDCVQIPLNIFDQRFLSLLPVLNAAGIGVMSRSVFLKGMIPASVERLPEELAGLGPYKTRLGEWASQRQFNVGELAFLFAAGQPAVSSTLIGVDSVTELEQVISWFENRKLESGVFAETAGFAVEDSFLIDPRRWRL